MFTVLSNIYSSLKLENTLNTVSAVLLLIDPTLLLTGLVAISAIALNVAKLIEIIKTLRKSKKDV